MLKIVNRRFSAAVIPCAAGLLLPVVLSGQSVEERLAALEEKIAVLENRVVTAEAETSEALERAEAAESRAEQAETRVEAAAETSRKEKGSWVSMDTLNPFVRHAWVNEAWTRPEPWQQVRKGQTEAEVIDILGEPTRTVDSLKPKTDMVFFYEGRIRDAKINGKISFRRGRVKSIKQPNFE